MSTYVLVHGAWHTGAELEPVAAPIRSAGHTVHLPTIRGNRPGDAKTTGLDEAIASICDYFSEHDITDAVLMGHSYGGMVITGVADRIAQRIRRLVYWNAFVPNDGECLNDMVPPHYVALFDAVAAERGDGSVVLPFPVWREAFINDADLATATRTYEMLNPHPNKTFTDKIKLRASPAEMAIAKSYINCTEDTALPHSLPWHPRLSGKLGLFRLVQVPGSHELCFSDPGRLAQAIMDAGRD
ncbi:MULTISPECIES: alpha/beta hydrolase [unclassified Bradyrhizobium]|uniref:alpha/beta hydrolase n=1 Tax=unclassified Bradyrhizobium TaxID=2631580 RepID=UPI0028E89978|nr:MULTISPECIES: alpha/beta hydrolase [unclassified Bradyrhizobium]